MVRIELAPQIAIDFKRILDHLESFEAQDAEARIQEIVEAIDVLQRNPMIGRPAGDSLRELVIGRGLHGYVALYSYHEPLDLVFVLAIRHQNEAGFRDR
jgi:toxin ParE1/3/4